MRKNQYHTGQPFQMMARFGGPCADCGCQIQPRSTVLFTPPGFVRKASIKHLPGECGSSYTVRLVYEVTSKSLRVAAYSAAEALEAGKRTANKTKSTLPLAYHVLQGDVLVLSEIVADSTMSAGSRW